MERVTQDNLIFKIQINRNLFEEISYIFGLIYGLN